MSDSTLHSADVEAPVIDADDAREVGWWGQAVALSFRFLMFGAIAIAIGWLVSNFRQVPPDSQAVIVRLGSISRVHGPGLLLALPKPIEQVFLVPATARQIQFDINRFNDSMIGQTAQTYGYGLNVAARLNSAFLLSGDSSVVHLQARVFYQVTSPEDYMIQAAHVGPALQRLFIASAVDEIAKRDLDSILVARPEIASQEAEAGRRERLRVDLVNAVNARLARLAQRHASLGITVGRIDLVPSIPSPAKETFDSVLAVTQDAERSIAGARTNAEISGQNASQEKDRIEADASARGEELVSKATSATASISALAQSGHDMSHEMLMSQLYYDRIEPIIKKAGHVLVVSEDGKNNITLPGASK